jgi:hypothetical protein
VWEQNGPENNNFTASWTRNSPPILKSPKTPAVNTGFRLNKRDARPDGISVISLSRASPSARNGCHRA